MDLSELVDDKTFLPRLMKLQECVCRALEEAKGPGLCFCGLTPAGRPPLALMDCSGGSCGVAWVAPVGLFPYSTFPQGEGIALAPARNCALPLAMRVEVGVARCHPRPRRGAKTLDPQDTFEAVRLYLSDMAAVKRAILCCFTEGEGGDYQVALETWAPIDPEASASGGTWTALIA